MPSKKSITHFYFRETYQSPDIADDMSIHLDLILISGKLRSEESLNRMTPQAPIMRDLNIYGNELSGN
jgi:hypothetical protein